MSRRPKLKQIKQVLGGSSTQDINGMFEEMMGMKDADASIILPKFVAVRNKIIHIYKILLQFSTGAICADFAELSVSMMQIKKYALAMRENIVFNETAIDETVEQYSSLSKEDLNALYKKLKNSQFTQQLIVQCSKLKRHSKDFEDITQLKDNFIKQEPGLSFYIFDFCDLDLKSVWANERVTSIVKKYILNILHVVYKDLFAIYQLVTSPDVDIDKFADVLMGAIDQLKKQPGLHRCDNAFKRISASVELLKGRFSNYYRESVASANPTIIIESFIVDVSNQGGADARLTREFRQIINHMNKVSEQSGRNKDPAIQKLFSMLNKNFDIMERGTKSKDSSEESVPEWLADIKRMDPLVIDEEIDTYKASAAASAAASVLADGNDDGNDDGNADAANGNVDCNADAANGNVDGTAYADAANDTTDYFYTNVELCSFDPSDVVEGAIIGHNGYRYVLTDDELKSNQLMTAKFAAIYYGLIPDGPAMKNFEANPCHDMPELIDDVVTTPLIE